jgi:hypothetical protein
MAFDLDAVMAEQEAAAPAAFTFTFDRKKYTMPRTPDVRAIMKIELDGDLHGGFAQLMGAEQWERLKASPKVLSTQALLRLYTEYVTYAAGVSPGESLASTRSSRSTAGRSKPTSKRATKSASRSSARKS